MRMDTRVSRATRIEVVTEGVLTRMLQSDPALEGVAAVIFDEFHERSLQADLGLALALDARENLAPDLKLLVMSATLDGAAVAKLLGDAPVVTAAGPHVSGRVALRGQGRAAAARALPRGRMRDAIDRGADRAARVARRAAATCSCSCRARGEIRRVQSAARDRRSSAKSHRGICRCSAICPAARPGRGARARRRRAQRKIVLATNIAETSLTIDGVRVVVDSRARAPPLFDPSTGMGRLETQRISRASAEQRQGSAGRLGAGRLLSRVERRRAASLAAFTPPEIGIADLAPLALDLASWGARDAGDAALARSAARRDARERARSARRGSARWMQQG